MEAICGFFRNLVVHFFAPLIAKHSAVKLIDSITNMSAQLFDAVGKKKKDRNTMTQLSTSSDQRKQDMLKYINRQADKYYERRVENEAAWRESLKAGDYVAAISHHQAPCSQFYQIGGWTPGKILRVDGDELYVSFINRLRDADEKIGRHGLELAPPGTYTNDLEWRWALKAGDLFDCCDDYGIWYRCTVQARYDSEESVDCEGNPVPMLSIVFRYPDPNGTKVKDGVKVTGWVSAQYDMEQELFSPSIQRFWAYST